MKGYAAALLLGLLLATALAEPFKLPGEPLPVKPSTSPVPVTTTSQKSANVVSSTSTTTEEAIAAYTRGSTESEISKILDAKDVLQNMRGDDEDSNNEKVRVYGK